MKGLGTQADPYIPETIPEFKQAVGTYDAYVKLDRDFDFNNNDTLWLWETILVVCNELNGNGYKLTNCYCYDAAMFRAEGATNIKSASQRNRIVRNLTMEIIFVQKTAPDSLWSNYGLFASYYRYESMSGIDLIFYDCDIRVKYYPLSDDGALLRRKNEVAKDGNIRFRRCIFNIDCYWNNKYIYLFKFENNLISNGSVEINYCELNINYYCGSSNNLVTTYFYLIRGNNLPPTCIFENNAVFINTLKKNIGARVYLFSGNANIGNCYFVVRAIYGSDTTPFIYTDSTNTNPISSTCFCDSSLCNSSQFAIKTNFYLLPTEKCKDASYLSSIGFRIG